MWLQTEPATKLVCVLICVFGFDGFSYVDMLEEHELTSVLNQLPPNAFDELFTGEELLRKKIIRVEVPLKTLVFQTPMALITSWFGK